MLETGVEVLFSLSSQGIEEVSFSPVEPGELLRPRRARTF